MTQIMRPDLRPLLGLIDVNPHKPTPRNRISCVRIGTWDFIHVWCNGEPSPHILLDDSLSCFFRESEEGL